MRFRRLTTLLAVPVIAACAAPSVAPTEAGATQAGLMETFAAMSAQLTAAAVPSSQPDSPSATPELLTVASPIPSEPAPASGDGPIIGNCPVYPPDNYWNTRVDSLPVDPNSAAYIAALDPGAGIHPDFGSGEWNGGPIGIPFMLIPASTPKVPISFYYPDDSDPGPYPIPANPLIEGGPDSDGDRHILLVDQDNCLLYEVYDAYPAANGAWEAGSGAIFDLRSNALRPDEWTSADAAGFAIFPGLVRYDEVASGEINHAIRFTAEAIRHSYIWPARHRATCGDRGDDDLSVPPMGQRFRLKASFDVSGYPHDVQVILVAMQTYGVVLADCGSNWFISGSPDSRWLDEELVDSLRGVHGSDFEAVDTSGLMLDPDSGQARESP